MSDTHTYKNNVMLLDCTLRDGGYYNSWDFPDDAVRDYIAAMHAAKIDIIEVGLRTLKSNGFKGAFAFCSDVFVNQLPQPDGIEFAVMVNASELVDAPEASCNVTLEEKIDKLFPVDAKISALTLVRLACHFDEIPVAVKAAWLLNQKGYKVGLNIMQISEASENLIEELIQLIPQDTVNVLYFADSLGALTPPEFAQLISLAKRYWFNPIGVHTHDNLGFALQNALSAHTNGASYIDSTVTGMGRGPGNARTEDVAIEFGMIRSRNPNLTALAEIIRRYFQPLKNTCGWGTNLFYYLSAKHRIHPTYIQTMLAQGSFSDADILASIKILADRESSKYSADILHDASIYFSNEPQGTWRPLPLAKGKPVMIIGNGGSVATHVQAIECLVRKAKPFVIGLNTQVQLDESLLSLRVCCHPMRIAADVEKYASITTPLVMPATMAGHPNIAEKNDHISDLGIKVEEGNYGLGENYLITPNYNVMSYALMLAVAMGGSQIWVVGFDGFDSGDPRQVEMQTTIETFKTKFSDIELVALTKTSHSINQSSLYAQ